MTIYSTLRAWFNHPLNQIKEEITALGESSIWGGFFKKNQSNRKQNKALTYMYKGTKKIIISKTEK